MTLNKWSSQKIREGQFHRAAQSVVWSLVLALASASAGNAARSHVTGGPAANNQAKNSSNLAREVHHQLMTLPFYSVFDYITFILDGRKVILSGQVLRPMLKKHAVAAIKSLDGVDTLVDQIEVLPSSETDDELRRAIYRAIYEDPALAPYAVQTVPPIHIVVKNGNVSLEGAVNSTADRNLAATHAGTVANVVGVNNNLSVQPIRHAPDQWDVR